MSEEEGSETPPQMEGISTLPPGYNVVVKVAPTIYVV